jgi:hypothetical protein
MKQFVLKTPDDPDVALGVGYDDNNKNKLVSLAVLTGEKTWVEILPMMLNAQNVLDTLAQAIEAHNNGQLPAVSQITINQVPEKTPTLN